MASGARLGPPQSWGFSLFNRQVALDPLDPLPAAESSAPAPATYRFATGGADSRLLLWEFNEADAAAQTPRGGAPASLELKAAGRADAVVPTPVESGLYPV